jgi:DNA-binding MarR family transcriptional regulator
MSKIIFLNGCGSSGKTSIARAIQHESPDLWLSFGVDTFIDMIPFGRQDPYLKFIPGQNDRGPIMHVESGAEGAKLFSVMPQFVIIATLMWFEAHGYDTTQILIVNWSKLDKMTVSKSLKKLVQMGLVNRIEHEVDTRAKSVSLTEKGKDMVRTLVPIVEGIDNTFFSKASDQEQKSFVQILAKLTAGISDE